MVRKDKKREICPEENPLGVTKVRISCHYTSLPKSEDMMGKRKPRASFRLLLGEVLRWGKFFKKEGRSHQT